MTPRLPRITAAEVIRALEQIGFAFARQSGSHKIYRNSDGKRVTIPFHGGKILHPKILSSIIRDADLTAAEFQKLLE